MKALILKDSYVLWKQMRIFVAVLVVMAMTGDSAFNNMFIVVWSSMLPYTAMAYDERSHWDQLAAMMPYSRRVLVLSKYVLGWLCMCAAIALCLAIQTAASMFGGGGADLLLMATCFCGGIIALDITLPLIFRFGVERGRLGFMVVVFGAAIGGGALAGMRGEFARIPIPVMAAMPLLAIIATVISVPLSMKLYCVNN